jgi:hypothetical protein
MSAYTDIKHKGLTFSDVASLQTIKQLAVMQSIKALASPELVP